ncbi:MAG: hypothetical protein RSB59_00650 [Clostridia bacterium]
MPDETRINIDLVAVNNQASTSLQLSEQQLININIQLAKAHKLASSLNGAFKNFQQTGQLTSKVTQWQKQQGNLNVFRQAKKNVTTKTMLGNAQYVDTRTNAIQLQAQKKAIDDQIKMSLGLTKAKKTATDLANETKKVSNNMSSAGKHLNVFSSSLAKTFLSFTAIKKAVGFVTNSLKKSADWTENLNLFEVTFGKASADTMDFALNVQKAYGIAANEIIRYTGLFKQMSEAIGIAENTSTEMSKTLTTLGYDIASLYNISTEKAMEKLQAGIAGQTKPLRQLGMDITAQSLDKYLGDMGLDYTSKMLNQADKMLLRTIVIVDQAKNAYGDMAKTINTFANQVKVLSGASENFKMAVGDLIIKPATTAITYLNGFIIAMTNVIRAFVPLSKTSGLNDTAESIGKVDEATKDLENTMGLLSFDKFESLSTGEGGASNINGMLTEEFAKKQAEYMAKFNEQMDKIKNEANDIAKSIQGWFMVTDNGKFVEWTEQAKGLAQVIAGIAGFGIVKGILNIKNATGELTTTMKLLQLAISPIGITVIAVASALLYMYTTNEDFRKSVNNLISTLLKLVGSALEPIVKVLNILMPIITKLLEVIGSVLAVIVNAISWVVDLLEKSHLLDGAIWVVIGTLGVLATAWAIGKIKDFIGMLKLSKTALLGVKETALSTKLAFVGIGVAIGVLAGEQLNKLASGFRLITGVLLTLGGVAMGVAIAVGAMQSAWSLGIAAAAIVAGIIAITSAVTQSQKDGGFDFGSGIKKFAQGGYPDRGQMFIAGEAGAEMVANIGGGQSAVANIPQIEEAMYRALKRISREESQVNNEQNINLHLDINGREFARATYPDYRAEGKRRGD